MKNYISKLYITFNRFNNIHVVLSTLNGRALFKKSYGCVDKNSKLKFISVQKMLTLLSIYLDNNNLKNLVIFFEGNGFNKFSFLKDFFFKKYNIIKIFYISTTAFNGCRQKKQRRLLYGQMSEWFKVPVLKTGKKISSWVRIPFCLGYFN